MITPGPQRARLCPIAACWRRRRILERVEERQERMRRLRVAAQVRTDLVATLSPTGATRHQAYYPVRGTDPVLGGPRSSAGGRGQLARTSFQPTVDRIFALR